MAIDDTGLAQKHNAARRSRGPQCGIPAIKGIAAAAAVSLCLRACGHLNPLVGYEHLSRLNIADDGFDLVGCSQANVSRVLGGGSW